MNRFYAYINLVRLNQPVGIFLLYLPCLYGIFLSATIFNDIAWNIIFKTSTLFFIGSVLMRSAGCVVNDLLDQKIDQKVYRTKNRPIASKKISNSEAIIILTILLIFSFLILIRFNLATIISGFIVLILVILYPLMKRITNYPQLFLGLTFNYGLLMSSFALISKINISILITYFSCVVWTIIYDTIYGFQDIKDDIKIGIRSSSISLSKNFKNPKIALYVLAILMFFCFILVGHINNFSTSFSLLILLTHLFLIFQIKFCKINEPKSCLLFFKRNIIFGILILISLIFEK